MIKSFTICALIMCLFLYIHIPLNFYNVIIYIVICFVFVLISQPKNLNNENNN